MSSVSNKRNSRFHFSIVLLLSRTTIQIPSLADIDLFYLLISLCFTLPILFASKEVSPSLTHVPTGNLNDLYLMRLIAMAHCVQILSSQGFLYEDSMNRFEKVKFVQRFSYRRGYSSTTDKNESQR